MSNRRTLRRLARTGDPTLVTEAGHRARALPAAAPPAPPPDDVILSVSYYDCDGNRIPVTSFTYSHGAVPARAAAEATDIVTYSGYGDALSESAPTAADRYRCTGRELDSVTGLQYNRIRWFDPSPGQRLPLRQRRPGPDGRTEPVTGKQQRRRTVRLCRRTLPARSARGFHHG
jgi:hypothetical protein